MEILQFIFSEWYIPPTIIIAIFAFRPVRVVTTKTRRKHDYYASVSEYKADHLACGGGAKIIQKEGKRD